MNSSVDYQQNQNGDFAQSQSDDSLEFQNVNEIANAIEIVVCAIVNEKQQIYAYVDYQSAIDLIHYQFSDFPERKDRDALNYNPVLVLQQEYHFDFGFDCQWNPMPNRCHHQILQHSPFNIVWKRIPYF